MLSAEEERQRMLTAANKREGVKVFLPSKNWIKYCAFLQYVSS